MHQNPVKRGLVAKSEDWRWSSYRFYHLDETGPIRVNDGWKEISLRTHASRGAISLSAVCVGRAPSPAALSAQCN
jgi:hypothetical protein